MLLTDRSEEATAHETLPRRCLTSRDDRVRPLFPAEQVLRNAPIRSELSVRDLRQSQVALLVDGFVTIEPLFVSLPEHARFRFTGHSARQRDRLSDLGGDLRIRRLDDRSALHDELDDARAVLHTIVLQPVEDHARVRARVVSLRVIDAQIRQLVLPKDLVAVLEPDDLMRRRIGVDTAAQHSRVRAVDNQARFESANSRCI